MTIWEEMVVLESNRAYNSVSGLNFEKASGSRGPALGILVYIRS